MTFSRSHAGMIGIISLFTGMIAPVVAKGDMAYPFPLTDLQTIAYVILFLLAIGFYLVSIRRWGGFRIVGLILLVILGYMSSIAFSGGVHTLQNGLALTDMRWGWIFIGVGALSILYTILVEDTERDGDISLFSDAIIGIIGTITLIGLSALIIGASIGGIGEKGNQSVLEKVFTTGGLTTFSGVTQSKAYTSITGLNFERKSDSISFVVPTSSGAILEPSGVWYPGSSLLSRIVAGKNVVTSDMGTWIDGVAVESGEKVTLREGAIIKTKDNTTTIISVQDTKSYSGLTMIQESLVTSEDTATSAWVAMTDSGYTIQKDGKTISEAYASIVGLGISKSGYDTMALARTLSGELIVLKNGVPVENIRSTYQEGSWKNNGSHSIYVTREANIKRIIYDGVSIGKEFTDVRETFLEKNGNAYAFFAQPVGENQYCIFTRFRGNLCGLTGYMNPRLSADGSSIIYAGLSGGLWSIYRNTDTVVRDTRYTHSDISDDYVFFDITNPKQYVFLERNDGKYQVRKNGKIIPGIWNDVGLNVTFGYDNKVIMSAQDDAGWKVIEF